MGRDVEALDGPGTHASARITLDVADVDDAEDKATGSPLSFPALQSATILLTISRSAESNARSGCSQVPQMNRQRKTKHQQESEYFEAEESQNFAYLSAAKDETAMKWRLGLRRPPQLL